MQRLNDNIGFLVLRTQGENWSHESKRIMMKYLDTLKSGGADFKTINTTEGLPWTQLNTHNNPIQFRIDLSE